MSIPRSARLLAVAATLALVAGCSGASQVSPPVIGNSGPQQNAAQSISVNPGSTSMLAVKKAKKAAIIYASDSAGQIYIYPQAGKSQTHTGEITNSLGSPKGLFADKAGNLFVANAVQGNGLMFKAGSQMPTHTYNDVGTPVDICAFGTGKNELVYLLNQIGSGSPNVEIYKVGSSFPIGQLADNTHWGGGGGPQGIACDGSGNVYVSFLYSYAGPGGVDEFVGGKGKAKTLPANMPDPAGVRVDKAGDVVVADLSLGIEFFHPTSGTPFKTLNKVALGGLPIYISFAASDSTLWVSDGNNGMIYNLNAKTGAVLDTITDPGYGSNLFGIAAFPPD